MRSAPRVIALHKVQGIKVVVHGRKHYLSIVQFGGKGRQLKKELRAERDIILYRKEVLDRFYRLRRSKRG